MHTKARIHVTRRWLQLVLGLVAFVFVQAAVPTSAVAASATLVPNGDRTTPVFERLDATCAASETDIHLAIDEDIDSVATGACGGGIAAEHLQTSAANSTGTDEFDLSNPWNIDQMTAVTVRVHAWKTGGRTVTLAVQPRRADGTAIGSATVHTLTTTPSSYSWSVGSLALDMTTVHGMYVDVNLTTTGGGAPTNAYLAAINLDITYSALGPLPPDTPANTQPADASATADATPQLRSSAYRDVNGDVHAGTQWQVRTDAGTWASPLVDSGDDPVNLTAFDVPSALADGHYWFRVRHKSSLGEWSAWSSETTFEVLPPVTITVAPQHHVAPNQATIWWETSLSSSTEVYWGPASTGSWSAYPSSQIVSGPRGLRHSATLAYLTPGTWYYRVRSTDAFGGVAISAERSFVVPAPANNELLDTICTNSYIQDQLRIGTKLYLAGSFTGVGTCTGGLASFKVGDATVAYSGPHVAGDVYDTIPDGDGGWYIAGAFTAVAGMDRGGVAHILPDGGLDVTFDPPAINRSLSMSSQWVGAIALSPDKSTLYAGGQFLSLAGRSRTHLAAIDVATGDALPLAPRLDKSVRDIQVDPADGSVYVVGAFTRVNGLLRSRAVKLSPAGVVQVWAPHVDGTVTAMAIDQVNNEVWMTGSFSRVNGEARPNLVRVDPVTGAAGIANAYPTGLPLGIALSPDGQTVYVAGNFGTMMSGGSSFTRYCAAAISTATGLQTAFAPPFAGNCSYRDVEVAPDGTRVYVGGDSYTLSPNNSNDVLALNPSSGGRMAWYPVVGANAYHRGVSALAVAPGSGEVVVGGMFSVVNGATRSGLARYDIPTRTLDAWAPSLGGFGGSSATIYDLELDDSASTLYIGGSFLDYNGTARRNAAAITIATGNLTAFDPYPDKLVGNIRHLGSSNSVLLAGDFATLNNGAATRAGIAKVDEASGIVDPSWDALLSASGGGTIESMDVSPDQSVVYTCGFFNTVNGGTPRASSAAFATSNAVATPWNPGVGCNGSWNVRPAALDVSSDGARVAIGGNFQQVGSASRPGLAVFDSASGVLDPFDAKLGDGSSIAAVAWATDGASLWVSGTFSSSWGRARTNLAQLDASTGEPTDFDRPLLNATAVHLEENAGEVLIGGNMGQFGSMTGGGNGRFVAAASSPPALDITYGPELSDRPGQLTVTWNTDAPATTAVYWDTTSHAAGTYTDYVNSFSAGSVADLRHSHTIADLAPGTYFIRVRSIDGSSNVAMSEEISILVGADEAGTPIDRVFFDGVVHDVSEYGGRAYVAGDFGRAFSTPSGGGYATIDPDGSPMLDGSNSLRIAGSVHDVASDGAGGWYVVGDFDWVGGIAVTNAAHILPDGGVDASWRPSFSLELNSVEFDAGWVYVGATGDIGTSGTTTSIARVDASSGARDTNWIPGTTTAVVDLDIDGGWLYAARTNITRYSLATGAADAFWNPNVVGFQDIAVFGGWAYIGGSFTSVGGNGTLQRAARVNLTNGAPDATFAPVLTSGTVYAITPTAGGVYLGGAFTTVGGAGRCGLARVTDVSGAIDPVFTAEVDPVGCAGRVEAIHVADGYVHVAGTFTSTSGGVTRLRAARFGTATGTVDATWNPSLSGPAHAMAGDGSSMWIAGSFAARGGSSSRSNLAAIDLTTGLLTSWDPGANAAVHAVAATDTAVYIGGNFTTAGGSARTRLARLDPANGAPMTWTPSADGTVNDILLDGPDVYVAGAFTTLSGSPAGRAGRINAATGVVDGTWNPAVGGGDVASIETAGGWVYLAGTFATANAGASLIDRITRVASIGAAVDPVWDPAPNGDVYGVALTATSANVVGAFSTVGVTTRYGSAKVDLVTGAIDTTFAGLNNGSAYGMASSGPFAYLNGQNTGSVTGQYLSTGALSPWQTSLEASEQARYTYVPASSDATAVTVGCSSGRLYIGAGRANVLASSGMPVQGLATYDVSAVGGMCGTMGSSLTLAVDAPARSLGSVLVGTDATATTRATVTTTNPTGWSLQATDESDAWGADCACGGSIPDWTGTAATPSVWAAGVSGWFGISVTDATGGRDARWGPGTGTLPDDHASNLYAGLDQASSATLHSSAAAAPTGADVDVAYRVNPAPATPPGAYGATVVYTAVASP